jgi:hypothetical protein
MRIGGSLALIALGAILKWGVTAQVSGVSLGVIGVVLMIVGAVGLVISLALVTARRRTDVVYGRDRVSYVEPVAPGRDRYYV